MCNRKRIVSGLWFAACLMALPAVATAQAPIAGGCINGACPIAPPAASAANPSPDTQAVVRVINVLGGARMLGSGTLIAVDGSQGLILTCAHLFREGTGTVSVTFPSGQSFAAQVAKLDPPADLAALTIAAPRVAPIRVAGEAEYPRQGEPLTSCGYGSDGRMWCNRGQALGYVSIPGGNINETLELSGSARQGDSGGPVLNSQRQLVAVIFGTDGRVVEGTFCGRIQKFLASILSPRQNSPDAAPAFTPPGVQISPMVPQPSDLSRLEQIVAKVQQALSGVANKLDALEVALQNVTSDEPSPQIVPPAPSAVPASPADNVAAAADSLAKSVQTVAEPWLSAKLAGLLISIGVPGGIAGVAAGGAVWLLMRRANRRLQARLGSRQSTDSAASDSVVERHHNRYVPYEISALDKAWAAAHAQVGQKYPAAVAYLKIAESVKDQMLSGRNSD